MTIFIISLDAIIIENFYIKTRLCAGCSCFLSYSIYSTSTILQYIMTQFRILATIALLSFTSATFASTVSWEVRIIITSNKASWVVPMTKKPISKTVIRKYTKIVSYMSPAGKELITFSLITKNGVITSASAIPRAINKISKSLQVSFSRKLSKWVVWKKVQNLTIDAIGWASLTTAAFVQFTKKAI